MACCAASIPSFKKVSQWLSEDPCACIRVTEIKQAKVSLSFRLHVKDVNSFINLATCPLSMVLKIQAQDGFSEVGG